VSLIWKLGPRKQQQQKKKKRSDKRRPIWRGKAHGALRVQCFREGQRGMSSRGSFVARGVSHESQGRALHCKREEIVLTAMAPASEGASVCSSEGSEPRHLHLLLALHC
jgi:hypothetical protein